MTATIKAFQLACTLLWCPLIGLAATFSISRDKEFLAPSGMVTFKVVSPSGGTAPAATWEISSPMLQGATLTPSSDMTSATYKAPDQIVGNCVQVAVTATVAKDSKTKESETAYSVIRQAAIETNGSDVQEPCPGSIIAVTIIGLEQAGGTSAKSTRKFFFDIFDSRPLPFFHRKNSVDDSVYGPAWRWWGTVRIASYPQQLSSPVGQLDIPTEVAKLPVNRIAGFGEFRAGLERRIGRGFRQPFLPVPGGSHERTTLGLTVDFGGLADLTDSIERVELYTIPPPNTPQRMAFDSVFPIKKYPVLNGADYVGLTGPDHPRFYWQYGAGFRLTTRYFDPDGTMAAAPALFSATFGQNELVTGGYRRGIVATFEGFYPLPLGPRGKNTNLIYLFGRADLRLGRASIGTTPLALSSPPTKDKDGNPITVSATDTDVAIIAVPSNRDLYSIGVGLDALQVINAIKNAVTKNTPGSNSTP